LAEYPTLAAAYADGWSLMQYSILTDMVTLRDKEGKHQQVRTYEDGWRLMDGGETFRPSTITIAGMEFKAAKL
jgi:hypothetical protein